VSSIVESPASCDLGVGKTVTFTLNLSEPVTVANGTPTLTPNDGGGTATHTGGSGSDALPFSCTVAAGQSTPEPLRSISTRRPLQTAPATLPILCGYRSAGTLEIDGPEAGAAQNANATGLATANWRTSRCGVNISNAKQLYITISVK
jgi:hypothetical protein